MSWFESRAQKERKSRFRQLVDMAMADGELDPSEQNLLESVAVGLNLSLEEVARILSAPEKVEFRPPQSLDERLLQLMEIVDMMRADNEVKPEEEAFALKMSSKLGIPPQKAPRLIEYLISEMNQGKDWWDVREGMKRMLKGAD